MEQMRLLFLTLSMLLATSSSLYSKKEQPVTIGISLTEAQSQPKPNTLQDTLSPQAIQDIYSIILKTFDTLESTIDSIGQSLASGASKLTSQQKETVQKSLYGIRAELEAIKQATAQHTDLQALCILASVTHEIIYNLQEAVDNQLLQFPARTQERLHKQLALLQKNTLPNLGKLLQENDYALIKLNKDVDVIGLTKTNQIYRKIRTLSKKYMLYDVAEHIIVYTAFVAWCAHITSEITINGLQGLDKNGNPLPKIDIDGNIIQDKAGNIVTENKNFLSKNIGRLLSTFQNFVGAMPHDETVQITQNTDLPGITGDKATGTISHSTGNKMGSPEHNFRNNALIAFTAGPLVNIPVGAAFFSYFTRDAKNLYELYKKTCNHVDNYLYGITKQTDFAESTIPKERFKDIVGREEIKTELSKIIEYIVHPDRYNRADIKISRGYLLAGSPQTGKTFMARALSGEISDALERSGKSMKVRFFEISTDNLKKNGIYYYIDLAKTFAPCILFFDELDLARLQRDGDSGLLSEFLQCMSEGLSNDEKDQVFILGVTNKPSNLDFALLQPGRFSKVIYFEKPTFQHRIDYFTNECHKRCMNMKNFDFNLLSQLTEGCHFGALKQVMRTACMTAKMEGSAVTQNHFERAIDTEVRQMIIGAPAIPENKEHIIAVHQAGKALASLLLKPEHELCQITVLPVTQEVEEEHVSQQYKWDSNEPAKRADRLVRHGEMFSCHTQDSLNLISQKELYKQCQILHAGNVAQFIVGLDQCLDKTDRKQAFGIAKTIVLGGLDVRDLSKNTAEAKLAEASALFAATEKEVETLLTPHKEVILRIAQALQKHKTLTAIQIKALL